jgi:hypothetical protein
MQTHPGETNKGITAFLSRVFTLGSVKQDIAQSAPGTSFLLENDGYLRGYGKPFRREVLLLFVGGISMCPNFSLN